MFLDLASSTSIAEQLGNLRFHALLSDVFACLSEVVTNSGGDVYKYVGDEMIATWPVRGAGHNAQPLICFFDCADAVEAARGTFQQRYGCMPRFRAGFHRGTVVAGEIGGLKREIAYTGDAMNTTARIEEVCREVHEPLLVSKPLMDVVALPPGLAAVSIGIRALRGKETSLELFAIRRADSPRSA
jgi:adenylate cyclase